MPCRHGDLRRSRRRRSRGVLTATPDGDRPPPRARNEAASRVGEIGGALTLLTRLPWPRRLPPPRAPRDAVWAFPLIGALLGVVVGATLRAGLALGIPPLARGAIAIGVAALLTGGLHEDGFADTIDAWSGGRTIERRLAILRDSRIGAHGALAVCLSVLARASCLGALPARAAIPVAVAAAVVGRTAIVPVLWLARPSRTEGLGASMGGVSGWRAGSALLLGGGLALMFAPPRTAVAGLLAGSGFAVWAARRRFGGFTGDLLGAAVIVGELAALLATAA